MTAIFSLPIFGIVLTIACFTAGIYAKKLIPSLSIPPLVSNSLIILIIVFTPLTLDQYMAGGSIINMFIGPVTVILALKIYQQRDQLKANIIPLFGGCLVGSVVSLFSVWFFSRLFDLDSIITMSILPKSVTTAIAIELSARSGGVSGLAISMVMITGLVSVTCTPFIVRIFKLKDPVALGVAIGSSGHALGTAGAIQFGETEGAMSGISIPVMGIITSIIWIIAF